MPLLHILLIILPPLITNPAHLGMQCLGTSIIAGGTNYSDWLPRFHHDLWTRTSTINAGLDLRKLFPSLPSVSAGVSYSYVYMNFGEFIRTGEGDPNPISTFNSYDKSSQFTFSLAADYFIKASFGMTFKHVTSHLADQPTANEQGTGQAVINLYDYGFLF